MLNAFCVNQTHRMSFVRVCCVAEVCKTLVIFLPLADICMYVENKKQTTKGAPLFML